MDWDHPYQVHLTGGEPFLKPDLLLHAVETASRLSIPRYVETNAGWCIRESLVEDRFRDLRNAGLDSILISCSPYHAEMIPPERTNLAIRKAIEIFGPQRVIVYLPEYLALISGIASDNTIPLEAYKESFGLAQATHILWEGYGIISGGRSGYCLADYSGHHPAESFRGLSCMGEILYAHHSHFDLYGHFISGFCGGLTVGSWHELPVLLDRFEGAVYPALIRILIESGPYGLMRLAESGYGYAKKPIGYAGKCHLCVDVRRHLIRSSHFGELEPASFYDHF
jgi:hypothetical protein